MERKELDAYTLAKRQQRRLRQATILGLVLGGVSLVLFLLGFTGPVTWGIASGSVVGVVLANSEVVLFGTAVSRRSLLEIIETQINRDPDAIAYLSNKS